MQDTKDDKPVGYKCPPLSTRFKPGQSGNPSGRPKTVKSLKAELIEELAELMNVSEDGHPLQVSKSRAIAKAMVREAAVATCARQQHCFRFLRAISSTPNRMKPPPEEHAVLDDYFDREVRRRASTSNEPNHLAEKESKK